MAGKILLHKLVWKYWKQHMSLSEEHTPRLQMTFLKMCDIPQEMRLLKKIVLFSDAFEVKS